MAASPCLRRNHITPAYSRTISQRSVILCGGQKKEAVAEVLFHLNTAGKPKMFHEKKVCLCLSSMDFYRKSGILSCALNLYDHCGKTVF